MSYNDDYDYEDYGYGLTEHQNSDKVKWIICFISLGLLSVLFITLCVLLFSPSKEDCAHEKTTHIAQESASCMLNGNVEYWHCESCERNFSDEKCTKVIENTIILAGHKPDKDGICTVCGYSENGLNPFPAKEGFYTYNGKKISDSTVYYVTEAGGMYCIRNGEAYYVYTAEDVAKGLKPIQILRNKRNGCSEKSYAMAMFYEDGTDKAIVLNNVKTPREYAADGICSVCGEKKSK